MSKIRVPTGIFILIGVWTLLSTAVMGLSHAHRCTATSRNSNVRHTFSDFTEATACEKVLAMCKAYSTEPCALVLATGK